MCGAVERKTYPKDQPAPRLLLEDAVAVSEVALFQAEVAQLSAVAIERRQAGKHVLDLDAISTDVLHRCRADGAGNQAQVFQTGQPLRQRVLHERMPGLASLGFKHDFAAIVA